MENYPYEVDPPYLEEVCTAIRKLRNNRALERMASQWRFARRALTPSAHDCIGFLIKCGCVRLPQITGVRPFFFSLYSRRETSEDVLIKEAFA